jgi:hypothetical protein
VQKLRKLEARRSELGENLHKKITSTVKTRNTGAATLWIFPGRDAPLIPHRGLFETLWFCNCVNKSEIAAP